MRRTTLLAVALVLAVSLQGAASLRLPSSNVWGDAQMRDIQNLFGRGRVRTDAAAEEDPNRRKEEHRAYFAIKLTVPPAVHDKFIDEWHKLEDHVRDDKYNIVYDLGKTSTDNLYFYIYGEWETGRDVVEHFESKAFQDFKDFTEDNDIEWEVKGLINISKPSEERRSDVERGRKKGGIGEERAHILIKYHVPPSHFDEFEEAWKDLAEDTWDEKDNVVYSLRKVLGSNTDYYAYGSWDTFDAYHDHYHSKHVRNFRDTVGDLDVVFFISPLEKFGEED